MSADQPSPVRVAWPRLFYVAAVVVIVSGIVQIGMNGYLIYCHWQLQNIAIETPPPHFEKLHNELGM